MATRKKKKVITHVTEEQAHQASSAYAEVDVSLRRVETEMDNKINAIKDKYQDKITLLQNSLSENFELLEAYAKEQKENWGKRKSIELLHSTIGFRTATPKVVKDRKFTWASITEIARKIAPDWVRSKYELDKDAIIAMRDEDGFKEKAEKCYINVQQDETFFVEPKKEEVLV